MKITIINICIFITLCIAFSNGAKVVKFVPTWTNILPPVFPVDLDGYGGYAYTTTLGGQIFKFPKADNAQQSQVVTWLDLSDPANTLVPFFTNGEIGGDEGLLSFEFHPDTITSSIKKFYTFSSTSPTTIQITAWSTTSTGAVDYSSAVPLLRIAKPLARQLPSGIIEAYLGGDLRFRKDSVDDDDDDSNGVNNLYISVGFGNDETSSQNVNSPLGKLLRITPNAQNNGYTVPTSNPFFDEQGLDEIYALGFRNPRKFSVAKDPSDIFIGDVGNFYDEVNRLEDAGQNFGYSQFDGCRPSGSDDDDFDDFTFPIHAYTDAVNPHTITLGPYYPASGSIKSLRERLLFADLYSGKLFSIQTTNTDECFVTNDDDDDGTTPTLVTVTEGLAVSSFAVIDNVVYATNVFAAFDPSGSTPGFYKLVEV